MANGMPISAVVGRRSIMKRFDDIFYSFTFGGEVLSLAAAIATIHEIKDRDVIAHLWEQGRKIRDGYNVLARSYGIERYTRCIGYEPRSVVSFYNDKGAEDLLLKSLFQQECIRRGVLFTGSHNLCYSHSDSDIDYTLHVYRTVLEIVAKAIQNGHVRRLLKGRPVEPVFRKA